MTTASRAHRAILRSALVLCPVLALSGLPALPADDGGEVRTLIDALRKGEAAFSIRYRWEHVDDDIPAVADEDGDASTLRTTLSYRTAPLFGFNAFMEFEDVSNLGMSNDHNDTTNGIVDHPVIADPVGTDLQQAYLRYSSPEIVGVSAGRMTLSLAPERYVGPVGWRQNQQSFDAAEVSVSAIPRTTLRLIYIDNVQRIFGDNREMSSPLVDAAVKIGQAARLTAYWYRLDYDQLADAALSTSTAGGRWEHAWRLPGEWSIPYLAEYAKQSDAGDNPADVDAEYRRLEVGGKRRMLSLVAGYELLGGDLSDGAFSTPLATLHTWNGWADRFLTTPPIGLQDLYLSAAYGWNSWSGTVIWHDFSSDSEDVSYGTEIDAVVQWKAPWKQIFAGKAAFFEADEAGFDTQKYWIYTAWSM